MAQSQSVQFRTIAITIAATIAALVVCVFLLALSGIYNVAASKPHWAITRWFIELGLGRSVALHSLVIAAPDLSDPNLLRLGAGHYEGVCALCHGAPGRARNPVVRHMLPQPPALDLGVREWSSEQLFWIVKHGLKYTGMPGWAAQGRDDEVWAVVAFLRELPNIDAGRYRELALGNAEPMRRQGREVANFGSGTEAISRCARCHGDENSPPTSQLIPKLAGLSSSYIARSLRNYAAGLRPSGIMQPVAGALEDDNIEDLARYYAALPVRRTPADGPVGLSEQIELGQRIARVGIPEEEIPPCIVCHGRGAAATFPNLAGQFAPYLVNQLELWQRGSGIAGEGRGQFRDRTVYGAIMTPIARRLSKQQIRAVAAYFASLDPAAVGATADTHRDGPRRGNSP